MLPRITSNLSPAASPNAASAAAGTVITPSAIPAEATKAPFKRASPSPQGIAEAGSSTVPSRRAGKPTRMPRDVNLTRRRSER
ncbi:MAG: hypothetical protein AB2L09_12810 [Coriobacteriia bacterium]